MITRIRRLRAAGRLIVAVIALAVLLAAAVAGDSRRVTGETLSAIESRIACSTDPVLVDITSRLSYPPFGELSGTGIVLDGSGHVLTNNHVVVGAAQVTVRDADGRAYPGQVLATDVRDDLALVRMVGATGLSAAVLGDSSGLRAGQRVFAIGNGAGGCGSPRIKSGVIRGLGRTTSIGDEVNGDPLVLRGLILSSVEVEPGYSGGALVDAGGRVVGLLTAGHDPVSCACYGSVYAIPIDKAAAVAAQMLAGVGSEAVHIGAAASLGVTATDGRGPAAPFATGALVTYLAPGSPADRLGLQPGNQILRIDGCRVHSALDLMLELQKRRPGDRVRIRWTDDDWHDHVTTTILQAGPPQ